MKRSLVNLLVIVPFVAVSLGLPATAFPAGEESASFYINRGYELSQKGQDDQAIAAYTRALEIDPGNVLAYNNRGNAYGRQGQYDLAIADLTKALEINPRNADAYHNRAKAYFYKKRLRQNLGDIKQAQSLGFKPDAEFSRPFAGLGKNS
jgi:tetratricopeptide (TPR) repeat protein